MGRFKAVFFRALGFTEDDWEPLRDALLRILTHADLRSTARVRVLRDYLAGRIAEKRAIIEGKK